MQSLKPNKIINQPSPPINEDEQTLLRNTRRTLAQLRTNKSSFLKSYLHKIDPQNHPSPQCPLCNTQNHDTKHLSTSSSLPTHLTPTDLWNEPVAVAGLLALWNDAMGAVRDPGWRNGDRDGRNTLTSHEYIDFLGVKIIDAVSYQR